MVQNVYVGPDGGRRQPDRVVWLGSGRAWGWGRSAEVLGPRVESFLVLARRLAGTIEKSTPSVSWRFGALRLWLRRGPAGGRGRGPAAPIVRSVSGLRFVSGYWRVDV